jgi:hypothetical protein
MKTRIKKSPTQIKDISRKKERLKQDHKSWEEFFTIYSGDQTKLSFKKGSPPKIVAVDDMDTVVTLREEEKLSRILHNAYQLKDTLLLQDLRKMPELSEVLNFPFVAENFEILRKAQIDWHATNWFNKDVFGAHAKELRRQLRRKRAVQPCPIGVANVVYDVNWPLKIEAVTEMAIRLCYYDIMQSRESDDRFEPLKVAIEIGRVLRDLIESMSLPHEKPQTRRGKQKEKIVSLEIVEGEVDNKKQLKPSSDEITASIDAEQEEGVEQDPDDFTDKLERAREKHDKIRQSKPDDGKSPLSPFMAPVDPEARNSHEYRIDNLKMVGDIELHTALNKMAGEITGCDITTRVARSGAVTPKAWKINFGEIKVFTKPPFTLKRVAVIVDLSDSMGCWCKTCCEQSGFEEGKSKAWMALQAATAIGKAFPDTTEIFGFSSDNQNTYIYPLEIGKEPMCRRLYPIAMGTPLCVALKRLEEISLSLDATMAVLITDGDPGTPAPLSSEHMREHTEMLSEELYLRGLRYCTVMIGTEIRKQLFPSETLVRIRIPSDLYKLQEILIKLRENWQ